MRLLEAKKTTIPVTAGNRVITIIKLKTMKRTVTAITITLLTLLAASCGKDKDIDRTAAGADRVTLGASLDNGTSRAGTLVIPDGHKLRYILEVWDTKNPANLLYREEKTATTVGNVEFTFQLTAAGDYKALLWADFIEADAEIEGGSMFGNPDGTTVHYYYYRKLHYITLPPLTSVTLNPSTAYKVNDPARDAFCAAVDIKKEVGAYNGAVTLTRPFGQLNLTDKNPALAATVASATLTYNVPEGFNVATGSPTPGFVTVNPTVTTPAAGTGLLLTDYIFAPASPAQTTLGEIAITFTSNDPAHLLDPFTVPANIPVQRNRRTNVSGAILHQSDAPSDDARLSVTVTDAWDGSATDKDIDLYIPDAAFRAFCITKGYADADGYIIKEKAAAVTTLDVSDMGIASLKGIEYFTALTELECYGNQLTTLDVTGCTVLTVLNCSENQLTTLDVTRCTALTYLECNSNQLSALNVKECTALTQLYCDDNRLTELDIKGYTALKYLYCDNNLLTTLDVTGCTALTTLRCHNNRLTTLDASGIITSWALYCGNQKDESGSDRQLTLTLRADQQERWENQANITNNKNVTPTYKSN